MRQQSKNYKNSGLTATLTVDEKMNDPNAAFDWKTEPG
jgi:hypothetical protein